jgi:hypothetical protein
MHIFDEIRTTNLLLGIMAGVSVFEALVITGIGIAAWTAYRKVTALIDRAMMLAEDIEVRQIAPAMHRVSAILDDVKDVTAKVKEETERLDQAIHTTIDRIDDTTDRVRANVLAKTSALVGFIRGARVAIAGMLGART